MMMILLTYFVVWQAIAINCNADLFCYTGVIPKADLTEAIALKTCPNENEYICRTIEADAVLNGKREKIYVVGCDLKSSCYDSDCSDYVINTGVANGYIIYDITTCKSKCCPDSYCNEPNQVFRTTALVPVVAPKILKCYTGEWTNGNGNASLKEEECPEDHICSMLSYRRNDASGVPTFYNYAGCTSRRKCQLISCNNIIENWKENNGQCKETCCKTGLCNDLSKTIPVPEKSKTTNDNKQLTCYGGSWKDDDIRNQNKVTCTGIDDVCLLSRYTIEVVPNFLNVTTNSGQCIARVGCGAFKCNELETAIHPLTLISCRLHCCYNDLCNTYEEMVAESKKEKCKLKQKSHDECCGAQSIDSKKIKCCRSKTKNQRYNPKFFGCCKGKKFLKKNLVCKAGKLQKRKIRSGQEK